MIWIGMTRKLERTAPFGVRSHASARQVWLSNGKAYWPLSGASYELFQHRIGVGHFELARRLDVDLLHDAVVDEHREPARAHPHARVGHVALEADSLRELGAAVAQHAHFAEGLLIATPGRHHVAVVDRDAPDLVDFFRAKVVVVRHVAGHVLRRPPRRVRAGPAEDDDALAAGGFGDGETFWRDGTSLAEFGGFVERCVGNAVANFDHARHICTALAERLRDVGRTSAASQNCAGLPGPHQVCWRRCRIYWTAGQSKSVVCP